MTDQIKPLESYRANGYKFRLCARSGSLAIFEGRFGDDEHGYHVTHIGVKNGSETRQKFYECRNPEDARNRFELELLKIRGKESAE